MAQGQPQGSLAVLARPIYSTASSTHSANTRPIEALGASDLSCGNNN